MASVPCRCILVGLILLACRETAFGGTYSDPSGFSFTYPDGWVLVNQAAMGDVNRPVPPKLLAWLARNKVDLNRVAVVLLREGGRDEFLENLNVVVEGQQIPVNDESMRKLTGVLTQKYGAAGVKMDNIEGRVQQVGSHNAIVVDYQSRMPGVPFPLRQRQVLLPGGGKTYIVTCTARANSFEKYRPTFEQVLASFQVPKPIAQGIDWNQVARTGVVGGIVGGLAGALAWIARRFTIRAKPSRTKESQPDTEEAEGST